MFSFEGVQQPQFIMGILIIFHCLVLMRNYDEAREWKENLSQLGFL
jgi:hypothetical protein